MNSTGQTPYSNPIDQKPYSNSTGQTLQQALEELRSQLSQANHRIYQLTLADQEKARIIDGLNVRVQQLTDEVANLKAVNGQVIPRMVAELRRSNDDAKNILKTAQLIIDNNNRAIGMADANYEAARTTSMVVSRRPGERYQQVQGGENERNQVNDEHANGQDNLITVKLEVLV